MLGMLLGLSLSQLFRLRQGFRLRSLSFGGQVGGPSFPLRRFVGGRAVGVLVLAGIGILGLTTDIFRSPRSVVGAAVADAARRAGVELRLAFDIRLDADRVGSTLHHFNLRAGPGPLLRSGGGGAILALPFLATLERRGVTLRFRGTTIVRDGTGYLRLSELPAYGDLGETLEGRWLQLGDPPGEAPRPFTEEESAKLLEILLAPDVLTDVTRGKREEVRGVGTRPYRLTVNGERLQAVLRDLPAAFPDRPAVGAVARYLEARLAGLRVDNMVLWIRSRGRGLVRARVELVPKDIGLPLERIVLDATVLPLTGVTPPEAPQGAVRLRPETLRKLLPR